MGSNEGIMAMAASPSISIAIVGSGGAGALTTADSLFETASAAGWHGLFTRTLGPQIPRSGHTVTSEEPAMFNAAVAELIAAAEASRWLAHKPRTDLPRN